MEMNHFGEADRLLAKAHTKNPNADLLEMISYVAAKKGEYPRAEQACRSALEMDPCHAPSLLSLGWILLTIGKNEDAREVTLRLDKLTLKDDHAKGREELRSRIDEIFYQTIECCSCKRSWKVPRDPPTVSAIRLYAMPPDELPAGSCPDCGKTYCIGCAKENLDSSGRFTCTACGKSLKLVNEGLKKIVYDWAVKDGLVKTDAADKPGKRGKKKAKEPED